MLHFFCSYWLLSHLQFQFPFPENKKNYIKNWKMIKQTLTLFRMGLFGAAHGAKRPPFPKLCHIHPTMMLLGTVISYPKKIQKTYKSCETPLEFRWYQHFFYRKSATFVVSRNTDIDCILIHNFNFFFFWVFIDYFNKQSCNFDDVSKIGYSRLS